MTDATTTATTTTTAPPVTTTTAATAAPSWYEGKVEPETVGFWQNKGYDIADPVKVAAGLTKQYREAEKLIGVPPDQLVRFPKDVSDAAGWKAVYDRLGVPDKPEGYDFSAVKNAAGEPIDQKIGDLVRATAVSNHLTKEAATAVAQSIVKHLDGVTTAQKSEYTATALAERQALEKNWGKNLDMNLVVAETALRKVAQAAGLTEAQAKQGWDAISKVGGIGASYAMEMLRVFGSRMGEAPFVDGGKGGNNLPMSREAAIAEIASLKADPVFSKRYLEKGTEEVKRMNALHAIAYAPSRAA